MQIVYAGEEAPFQFSQSLFLAGPTPRNKETPSWRPEALKILGEMGFQGVVFVPELKEGSNWNPEQEEQIKWEHKMLDMSDCILFWIPRELKTMPALTTNIEFGLFARSGKVVAGAPPEGQKNNYIRFCCKQYNIPWSDNLRNTLKTSLHFTNPKSLRTDGQRQIPLIVWNLDSFQSWFKSQHQAGNRLDGAKVEYIFRVGKNKEYVYLWVIHANIHIAKENRNKTNELVMARKDLTSVVLYARAPDILDTKIILIREFRSPANTKDALIWENPGGSSRKNVGPVDVAIEEVYEEVGLNITKERLRYLGSRQVAGTMSAHRCHVYAAQITPDELTYCINQKNIPHGADLDNPTGERAYIEVVTLRELREKNLIDWSNLGMIETAIR